MQIGTLEIGIVQIWLLLHLTAQTRYVDDRYLPMLMIEIGLMAHHANDNT